ncbi:MAG: TetR/AcrR family transcriptional regulator [Treponema sp.]|nr:TetR/AcrR family transcriptional regulator [Treponema sp.]
MDRINDHSAHVHSTRLSGKGFSLNSIKESTKEKIFFSSIRLFSQIGYNEVTIRDIAKDVGIKSGSIYNHFKSKKEILDEIYEYYDEQWNKARPDIDKLLRMAETDPPAEVLMRMLFDWKPEIKETMNRIYIIATREAMLNSESLKLVQNLVMERNKLVPRLLLERMIELGRIEPIDIIAFVNIFSHVAHSATSLNLTPLKIETEDWYRCWNMLLSIIKPTGK